MLISSPSLAWFLGFGRGTADATAPMTPETDLHRLFVRDGADFPPKSETSSPELVGVGSGPGAGAEGGAPLICWP